MADFSSKRSKEREDADGWTWVIGKHKGKIRSTTKEYQSTTTPTATPIAIFTFYLTNFPLKWDHITMKDVFAKYGKVVDVFIASKRNKLGKRFGFARFENVSNPTAFEKLLSTISVGSQKLWCNIAHFQRRPFGSQTNSRVNRHTNNHTTSAPIFAAEN
ncbi:cytochrome P450 [Tanacetum coccineum]